MARIEKTVFISYRRKDVSWALAVYQDLTHRGYDVFFDFTSISGGDFEQIILSNIKARAHFVLILTPTALDRCSEPDDWLRREIETGIDEKRNIIPLFFDGFSFGATDIPEKLTGKLASLSRYNGMNVHQDYFLEAMTRLRTRFLSIPLDTVLHPMSPKVQEVVLEEQRAANKAAWLAKVRAEFDAIRKRLKETVGKIKSLIPSSSRVFAIGWVVLIGLLLFGINALLNGPPAGPSESTPAPIRTSISPLLTRTNMPPPTFPPNPGIGSIMISEKDDMVLVFVPAGEFTMGSDSGGSDVKPVHQVSLDAFWIDQTEVTNTMYAKCVADGGCKPPSSSRSKTRIHYFGNSVFDEFPVIHVDWHQAEAYCEWAGRKLPTEAQWEKAARGTDGRVYPWGENIDCFYANYWGQVKGCVGDTSEAGSYESGKSLYGSYDMAGNVSEWVYDWYDSNYYQISPLSNPTGPISGSSRVLRGGSWNVSDEVVRSIFRYRNDPTNTKNYIGFRCSLSHP
ncbi:MAG: SUMF1/EgtB/PvdO family nonheme iron enzyme [Anaerolineales bacterium]|nr:MAG: SUMF1/EgtB/PvdO family nonheme iron enzyme [Anaerolineales bacterium]